LSGSSRTSPAPIGEEREFYFGRKPLGGSPESIVNWVGKNKIAIAFSSG